PRTLRVHRPKGSVVDLGTIPLAGQDTLITIWRVGCPHQRNTPPAEIPTDLEALITAARVRVEIRSFSAAEVPGAFARAREVADRAGLPDIVTGINYGPFGEVLQWHPPTEPRLARMSGLLVMIDDFAFLVTMSPGHAAARQIATTNRGMSAQFSWS